MRALKLVVVNHQAVALVTERHVQFPVDVITDRLNRTVAKGKVNTSRVGTPKAPKHNAHAGGKDQWDHHESIPRDLPPLAQSVDQPISGLLADLKQRGLLSDTLVVFTSEFGRMPFTQGVVGRDHNAGMFVTWLAGAGIRRGVSYGKSDEFSYRATENATSCHDLHATILHLLGIDHERLTVRHNGVNRRLTDVHGHVIKEILA